MFLAALSCISLQIGLPSTVATIGVGFYSRVACVCLAAAKLGEKGATRIDLYTARLRPYRTTTAATTTAQ